MAFHCALSELSDVLLALVLVREPVDLPFPVKLPISEVPSVLDASGLLSELTTVQLAMEKSRDILNERLCDILSCDIHNERLWTYLMKGYVTH